MNREHIKCDIEKAENIFALTYFAIWLQAHLHVKCVHLVFQQPLDFCTGWTLIAANDKCAIN